MSDASAQEWIAGYRDHETPVIFTDCPLLTSRRSGNIFNTDPKYFSKMPTPNLRVIKHGARHREHGGATESPFDLPLDSGYLVGADPDRSFKVEGSDVAYGDLLAYWYDNWDLISLRDCYCIGSWFNVGENTTYLDVVAYLTDRDEAVVTGSP